MSIMQIRQEISKGEFRSVCQVVGGINVMINEDCKDKGALTPFLFFIPASIN